MQVWIHKTEPISVGAYPTITNKKSLISRKSESFNIRTFLSYRKVKQLVLAAYPQIVIENERKKQNKFKQLQSHYLERLAITESNLSLVN